jgi:hypothetical protein
MVRLHRPCGAVSGGITEINATKLLLYGFEEPDVFLPFRDIGFNKDGIPFAELGDHGLALSRVHIDYRELPSLLCEIISERESNAFPQRQRRSSRGLRGMYQTLLP